MGYSTVGVGSSIMPSATWAGTLVAVLVIGFAVGRRERATVGDYFRTGNRLPSSRRRRLPG